MLCAAAHNTHFVNCRGTVSLIDCHFEGQLDDATNVHGNYLRIRERISARTLIADIVHFQQAGVLPLARGDTVSFVDGSTLLGIATATVTAAELLDPRTARVTIDRPLPPEVRAGDGVENVSAAPDVVIRGCRAGKNRARGFLIGTPGKVLIEDNHVYTEGAAIKIGGDMRFVGPEDVRNRHESGAVRDVTVRGNTLESLNLPGVYGQALIDVDPDTTAEGYHSGIRITDNTLHTAYRDLVFARSVEGLIIEDNQTDLHTASSRPALS